jgi:DNA-directed RNA polymerase subunit RPC12/RpoP
MILPGLRCPTCGAAERNLDDKRIERPLACVASRLIGRTRQADYLCRDCGLAFRVNFALDWKRDSDSAKATIIDS